MLLSLNLLKPSPKSYTEFSNVSNAIKTNPEIGTFANNPTLSLQERNKGLQGFGLFAKLEGTVAGRKDIISDVTKKLFSMLSENGYLGGIEGIIKDSSELRVVAQHKGELTIMSATPLGKDILTRLETILKRSKAAQGAKVVIIANKVC